MIKRIIAYYSFIVVSIIALTGFVGASTFPQLLSAVLFFPVATYFWLIAVPRKKRALVIPTAEVQKPENSKSEVVKLKSEKGRDFDMDRRMFIKLIGSAGMTVFLMSIFTKKAHGAFFGSVPGPGTVSLKNIAGVQIDPAEKHPTDGYKINQIDDSSPSYFGFTDKDGAWFILRENTTGDFRYAKGGTDFPTNWTNRAVLSYDYYDNVF